jgi:hypothetical protein
MLGGIQVRGPHQYRVQVRRNGVYETKTFEITGGISVGVSAWWRLALFWADESPTP